MKENLLLTFKGFLVGCGKIIPGVSGAMIAISLGIYDKAINAILHIFSYKNIKYLAMIGIGIVLSVILLSNGILFLIRNFYVPVMFLFIGLISGGSVDLIGKSNIRKNYIFLVLPIIFLLLFEFMVVDVNLPKNFLTFMLVGGIDALTMIIPGVSGTAVLMILNFYDTVMTAYSILDLSFLIPFFIGMGLVTISFIKVIDIVYNKWNAIFNSVVLGLSIGSIIILIMNTLKFPFSFLGFTFGMITFIMGFIISLILDSLK